MAPPPCSGRTSRRADGSVQYGTLGDRPGPRAGRPRPRHRSRGRSRPAPAGAALLLPRDVPHAVGDVRELADRGARPAGLRRRRQPPGAMADGRRAAASSSRSEATASCGWPPRRAAGHTSRACSTSIRWWTGGGRCWTPTSPRARPSTVQVRTGSTVHPRQLVDGPGPPSARGAALPAAVDGLALPAVPA